MHAFVQRRFTPLGNTFLSDADEDGLLHAFESIYNKKPTDFLKVTKESPPGATLRAKDWRRRSKSCCHFSFRQTSASAPVMSSKSGCSGTFCDEGCGVEVDCHVAVDLASLRKPSGRRGRDDSPKSPCPTARRDDSPQSLSPTASTACTNSGSLSPIPHEWYISNGVGVAIPPPSPFQPMLRQQGPPARDLSMRGSEWTPVPNAKSPDGGRVAISLRLQHHIEDKLATNLPSARHKHTKKVPSSSDNLGGAVASITPAIIMSLAKRCNKDLETPPQPKAEITDKSLPNIRESLRQRGLGVLLECSP